MHAAVTRTATVQDNLSSPVGKQRVHFPAHMLTPASQRTHSQWVDFTSRLAHRPTYAHAVAATALSCTSPAGEAGLEVASEKQAICADAHWQ
jgi:hypothetical protein